METDIDTIEIFLRNALKRHVPPLKITTDSPMKFEVHGTIPTMQGRQKVDGMYFASIVPKPKDIRLYFFPIYTHQNAFNKISEGLRKCLKGKSCFHIKKIDTQLKEDIESMIQLGVRLYKEDKIV